MIHHIRHEGLTPLNRPRRLHTELVIDVHILHIHGRVRGHLVAGQLLLVVQGGPVVGLGEQLADFRERAQLGVVGQHPREDHLAGEVERGVVGLVEGEGGEVFLDAVGGPVGGVAAWGGC